MAKAELLDKFFAEQVEPKSQLKLQQLREYCEQHYQELVLGMLAAMQKLCLKVQQMQQQGLKGKLASIDYILRRVDLVNHHYVYQVEALDERWLDDPVRCRVEYEVSWAFKFLDEFEAELAGELKTYLNQINLFNLQNFKLKEITKYHEIICELAEAAFENLEQLLEFQVVAREPVFEVSIEEYKMPMTILYKEDQRVKDSRQVKRWLELKEESYRYEILKNLDLSEGDYAGIKLNRGDLSGSNLVKSDLSAGMFVKTKFQGCLANEADFSEANLYQADFRNASLVAANFRGAFLQDACFDGANLMGADLRGAELGGATFLGAILNEALFEEEEVDEEYFEEADDWNDGDDKF